MFRYILALLVLLGMFSLPLSAQDKDGTKKSGSCAPTKEVSHLTTFTIVVVTFVEKSEPILSIRVNEDGTASCRHVVKSGNEDFSKTVTTDVNAKLTADEIK